jgi:hypothetical protein
VTGVRAGMPGAIFCKLGLLGALIMDGAKRLMRFA